MCTFRIHNLELGFDYFLFLRVLLPTCIQVKIVCFISGNAALRHANNAAR